MHNHIQQTGTITHQYKQINTMMGHTQAQKNINTQHHTTFPPISLRTMLLLTFGALGQIYLQRLYTNKKNQMLVTKSAIRSRGFHKVQNQ